MVHSKTQIYLDNVLSNLTCEVTKEVSEHVYGEYTKSKINACRDNVALCCFPNCCIFGIFIVFLFYEEDVAYSQFLPHFHLNK